MLSDKSYRPNRIRGIALIISCMAMILGIRTLIQTVPQQAVFYFFSKQAKTIFRTATSSFDHQSHPQTNLSWKIEPSGTPTPSPAALLSSQKALPSITPQGQLTINMGIKATITGTDIGIDISVFNTDYASLTDAKGYIIAQGKTYPVRPTDAKGNTSIMLTDIPSGATITITETYEGVSVTESLVTS